MPIKLTLGELRDILFETQGANYEYKLVVKHTANMIKGADQAECYFHVCIDEPDTCIGHLLYTKVWRSDAWKNSVERLTKERKHWDSIRRESNLKTEAMDLMVKNIMKLYSQCDEDTAKALAIHIIQKKEIEKAKLFGVDLTKEYKEIME